MSANPSFSSFPDFAVPAPRREDDGESRQKRGTQKEATKRREREDEAREERRKKERRHAKLLAEREDAPPQLDSKRPSYDKSYEGAAEAGYYSDAVGDKDVLRYGLSASQSAPRYRRNRGGRVLGLNEGIRIMSSAERTKVGLEISPLGRPYVPRYSSRPIERSITGSSRRLLLRRDEDDQQLDPSNEFVNFDARARSSDTVPEYRRIHSMPEEVESDEWQSEVEALGPLSTFEEEIRKKRIELERTLKTNPTNTSAWLQLSTLRANSAQGPPGSSLGAIDPAVIAATRAENEVSMSVLNRALAAHPDNAFALDLHLAFLSAAEQVWPVERVHERWRNVLREMSRSGDSILRIWLAYLDWCEGPGFGSSGHGTAMSAVEAVIDAFTACLQAMSGIESGESPITWSNKADWGAELLREENQIYLFLRACIFMRQAGFSERSEACFQAMVEITFFKPDHLRPGRDPSLDWFGRVLHAFETFWDEELPRIGEEGAAGWRSKQGQPSSRTSRPPKVTENVDSFQQWLEAERDAEARGVHPARATDPDELDESDPFRVVLFDDIRPFLFPIRSPEARLQLIYAFLHFLGLPVKPPDTSTSSPSASDPHLYWTLTSDGRQRSAFWPPKPISRALPWQTVGGEPMEPERPQWLSDPFSPAVHCWLQDQSSMFAGKGRWFADLDEVHPEIIDTEFVRRALATLRPIMPDPHFTLVSFAFESAMAPKRAIKLAKMVLTADRDNFVLWDGYARVERQRGNFAAARTVYATALQAARALRPGVLGLSDEEQAELWASWAEMEWEQGNEARCLAVLLLPIQESLDDLDKLSATDQPLSAPSPSSVLKARTFYSRLPTPCPPSLLSLRVLYAYLADNLDAATQLLLEQSAHLAPESSALEHALQLLAKITHFHRQRHPLPAAIPRSMLEQAIDIFPNNTYFLSLYLWGELRGRVYGRVQRLTGHLSGKEFVGGLWSIWAEGILCRSTFWDAGGGGAERVRAVLGSLINSSARGCAGVWMLYIEFECLMGRFQAAKQLIYRAVASVGGSKELYLVPFTAPMRPHFTPRELREWSDVMLARGLRLRIPFDDYFPPLDDDEPLLDLPEDEELHDDELEFLRERQTLKPY